jgi:hypothetical protein
MTQQAATKENMVHHHVITPTMQSNYNQKRSQLRKYFQIYVPTKLFEKDLPVILNIDGVNWHGIIPYNIIEAKSVFRIYVTVTGQKPGGGFAKYFTKME